MNILLTDAQFEILVDDENEPGEGTKYSSVSPVI